MTQTINLIKIISKITIKLVGVALILMVLLIKLIYRAIITLTLMG